MDMNGFDDTRETFLNHDSDEISDSSSPESENDFSRQIQELRLQLERLEAFQRAPKSNAPVLADAHQDQEEEIDQPESPAGAPQPPRRAKNSGVHTSIWWRVLFSMTSARYLLSARFSALPRA